MENVSASHIKDFLLIGGGLLTIIGAAFMLFRKSTMDIQPQPILTQHAVEFVTKEQCVLGHESIQAQLIRHERQIESLWLAIRDENTAIRAEIGRGFKTTEHALGLIEGELKRMRT